LNSFTALKGRGTRNADHGHGKRTVQLKSRALAPKAVPKNKHTNLGRLKAESFRKKQNQKVGAMLITHEQLQSEETISTGASG